VGSVLLNRNRVERNISTHSLSETLKNALLLSLNELKNLGLRSSKRESESKETREPLSELANSVRMVNENLSRFHLDGRSLTESGGLIGLQLKETVSFRKSESVINGGINTKSLGNLIIHDRRRNRLLPIGRDLHRLVGTGEISFGNGSERRNLVRRAGNLAIGTGANRHPGEGLSLLGINLEVHLGEEGSLILHNSLLVPENLVERADHSGSKIRTDLVLARIVKEVADDLRALELGLVEEKKHLLSQLFRRVEDVDIRKHISNTTNVEATSKIADGILIRAVEESDVTTLIPSDPLSKQLLNIALSEVVTNEIFHDRESNKEFTEVTTGRTENRALVAAVNASEALMVSINLVIDILARVTDNSLEHFTIEVLLRVEVLAVEANGRRLSASCKRSQLSEGGAELRRENVGGNFHISVTEVLAEGIGVDLAASAFLTKTSHETLSDSALVIVMMIVMVFIIIVAEERIIELGVIMANTIVMLRRCRHSSTSLLRCRRRSRSYTTGLSISPLAIFGRR